MGDLLSAVTGFSAGIVSGTALCAFYIALGVFSKSIECMGLNRPTPYQMESHTLRPGNLVRGGGSGNDADTLASVSAATGGLLGIAITIFGVKLPIGAVFASLSGLFGGVYVGIVIACLAEVTDAIPVVKNFGLTRRSIVLVLLAFVLGKTAGSLIYWLSGVF